MCQFLGWFPWGGSLQPEGSATLLSSSATGTSGNLEAAFVPSAYRSSWEAIIGPGTGSGGQRQLQGNGKTKESRANVGGNRSGYIHQGVIGWGALRESLEVRHCPILAFFCGGWGRGCQVIG